MIAAILYSCTFLSHVKIVIKWLVCYVLLPIPCISASWHWYSKWLIEVLYLETTTQQETFQPVAFCLNILPAALYTLSLPMEVNTDVIFSLFHWSLVPLGAVQLAFSLKVNLIWTTAALVLACCLSVLRSCLYWLLWNEITPHCKVGLSPVGHS